MDGQLSFATLDYAGKKKRTKRDASTGRDGRSGAVAECCTAPDPAALSEGGPLKAVDERIRCRRVHACVDAVSCRHGGSNVTIWQTEPADCDTPTS